MIEWIASDILLVEAVSDVMLGQALSVTLAHYDPVLGIDTMAIGTTFEVA